MQVSLIIMSFSTAEQYPKLVNGPPPEWRRVGKDLHMLSSYVFKMSQTEIFGIDPNGLSREPQHLLMNCTVSF